MYLCFINNANLLHTAYPERHVPVAHTDAGDHESTPVSELIPDEDILRGAVTDPNILAEVKLPKKPSMPS